MTLQQENNGDRSASEFPSMDEAVRLLAQIADDSAMLPTTALKDTKLDSLDVLEWMYELGIEADDLLDDEEYVDSFEEMTAGELYEYLVRAATRLASSS